MTKWIFRQYIGDLIPDDVAEMMKAKGMKPPAPVPALDNAGNCSVFEVDDAGEVVGTVALVRPVLEPKRGQGHKLEDPERDARAHLIAAAPELLESLKVLVFQSTMEGGPMLSVIEAANAAIAKAEGKS